MENYDALSREELIRRIHQLEDGISGKPDFKENYPVESNEVLIENLPISIVTTDLKGQITAVNRFAKKHTELRPRRNITQYFENKDKSVIESFLELEQYPKFFDFKQREFLLIQSDKELPVQINIISQTEKKKIVRINFVFFDLSLEKAKENELYVSELKYKQLVASLPDMVLVHVDGIIRFINDAMKLKTGFTEKQMLNRKLSEFVHPDDQMLINEIVKNKNADDDFPSFYKLRIITHQKDYRFCEIRSNLIEFEKRVGVISVLTDITDKLKVEKTLRSVHEQFISFLEKIPAKTFIKDEKGRFLFVNNQWNDIFGNNKKWIGRTIEEVMPPEQAKARIELHRNTLKNGKASINEEFQIGIDTKKYFQTVEFKLNHETEENVIGGMTFETTELKEAENLLNQQKVYFQRLFDFSPEAIVILDNQDRIVNVNSKFCALFQYQIEDIKGRKINSLIVPKDLAEEASNYSKMTFKNGYLSTETVRKRKDGKLIDVSILANTVVINDKLTAILAIYRNIAERKRFERQLRLRNEEMKSANEELSSINEELNESRNQLIKANKRLMLTQFTVDSTSEAVFWVNEKGDFVFVNHAASKMLGYPHDLLMQKNIYDIDKTVTPEKWKKHWDLLKIKKTITFESQQLTINNHPIEVEISSNYVEYENTVLNCAYSRDISQRKYAERILVENEERFRNITENIIDGIAMVENQKIVFANKRFLEIIEIQSSEINEIDIFSFFNFTEPIENSLENYLLKTENRNSLNSETWIITKNGKRKFVFARYINKRIESKAFNLLIVTDFTIRKQYEDAIMLERNLLKNVIENNPYAIIITNREGKIIRTNKEYEELFGEHNEEYSFFEDDLFVQNQVDELIRNLKNKILLPEIKFYSNILDVHNNKVLRYLRVVVFPILDNDNKVDRIVAMFQDITAMKNAQIALAQSEELFRNLVDTTAFGIFIYQGKDMLYMNKAAEIISGYSSDEIKNIRLHKIIHPEYWHLLKQPNLSALYSDDVLTGMEIKIITKDHTTKWIDIRGSWVSYHDAKAVLYTFIDITDRVNAQELLIKKNKELEHFIYITSHDIRSPLVNIQGFSKELEIAVYAIQKAIYQSEDVNSLRASLDDYFKNDIPTSLKYIYSSTDRMETLLGGVLKLSRMGRIPLTLTHIDMNELLGEVVSDFQYIIQEAEIDLHVEALPSCIADRSMINQVFSNLIDNAIKYRKLDKKCKIRILGNESANEIVYLVKDNGIGISKEQQKRIFDIFQRFSFNVSGEGLGLTIIKRIVERHDGEIWVNAEPGIGTSFSFSVSKNLMNKQFKNTDC